MGNEKELTNWDLIYFFANKSVGEGSVTQSYLDQQKSNLKTHRKRPYVDLAFSFKFFRMLSDSDHAEDSFKSCEWLKLLAKKYNLDVCLDDVPPDKLDEKTFKADFQKWHLIVSWFALKCFEETERGYKSEEEFLYDPADKKGNILYNKPVSVKCTELLLWMCEVSAGKAIAERVLQEGSENLASRLKSEIKKAVSAAEMSYEEFKRSVT